MGQQVRCPGAAARLLLRHRQEAHHRCEAVLHGEAAAAHRDEEGQRKGRGASAEGKRPDRVKYPATQKGAARWQHLFALFTNRLFDPPPFF